MALLKSATIFTVVLIFTSIVSSSKLFRNVECIVNGFEATPGQFPYQVFIKAKWDAWSYAVNCGGSILNNEWVIMHQESD